jgi:hypothetical protein
MRPHAIPPNPLPARVVKPKKRCCKSRPRCKKCPVVCQRLAAQGLAIKGPDGQFVLAAELKKKQYKAARKKA